MTPLLGLTIDILVFATVFVYMPIANYIMKRKQKCIHDLPVERDIYVDYQERYVRFKCYRCGETFFKDF